MALPAGRRLSFENSISTCFGSAAAELIANSIEIADEISLSHGIAPRLSAQSRRSGSRARPMCLPNRSATAPSEADLPLSAKRAEAIPPDG
jgi:hypothetical protein